MIKQPTRKTDFASNSVPENRTSSHTEVNEGKTKLEIYVEILCKYAYFKQENAVDAVTGTPENYTKALDYLAEQGLIQKKDIGKTTVYSTTRQGLSVLKYFNLIKTISKITYNKR